MAAPPPGSGLFYNPEPSERAYYDGLFQAADRNRTGQIGGAEAVAFFTRSKLPMEQLKNIWTVADNPPTNALDRPKFAVAIRLLQLLQNGVKGQGSNLAAPPGSNLRPVFLEGISGTVVPMPGAQPPQQQQQPTQQQPTPQQQQTSLQQQQPGGPAGGPTPPQQQQQRPQQPPQHMNAGGRPPMAPGPTPSTALTVQDPYTMTPAERQRYESIFPQYSRDDGFMYGSEAVGLFSKSGLNQTQLRDIWNIVDQPVDNKLDPLEFAIAMHLIVCVSKKNLPMPKGLPISLKGLKQQQHKKNAEIPEPPAQEEQQQARPLQQMQPPLSMARVQSPADMSAMTQPTMQGPPPLAKTGSIGISDAFEGLSATDNNLSASPSPSSGFGGLGGGGSFGAPTIEQKSPRIESTPAAAAPSPPRIPESVHARSMASSIADEAPKSTEALAGSYKMEDSSGELVKLKGVLQKLQAENISLKAQLGTMSDEEKDVQKEINAIVSEIGALSNRLTELRSQVLASKTRLLEKTAELKAAHEKKGIMSDLIGEAEATKEAIESAYEGLEQSVHNAHTSAPRPAPAPAPDVDLFSWGNEPTPAPAPAPTLTPPLQASPSYGNNSHHSGGYGGHAQANNQASPAPVPYSNFVPAPGPPGPHHLETVSSDDSSAPGEHEQFDSNPEQEATPMFSYDQNQGGSNPFGDAPAPAQGPSRGVSYEQQVFRGNPPPSHHKENSIVSNLSFGEVMGGGAPPQSQFAPHEDENEVNVQSTPSMDQINQLKAKAEDADQLARDAENTHLTMVANANELRRIADEAEAIARSKLAEAIEKKKKGIMGGGGKKKKSMKEATQAKADAEEKKKKFLAAQSQANDAQSVAMETKREAEKLREQYEQVEMDAAAQASMQHKQPEPEPAPASQAQNGGYQNQTSQQQSYGQPQYGHGQQQGYGYQPTQQEYSQPAQHGYSQPPPSQQHGYGGYGQQPPTQQNYAMNPNVMSQEGGGIDIPTPTAGTGNTYADSF